MRTSIVIGSDFAGFDLKEAVKNHLLQRGFDVSDVGMTDRNVPVPYHIAGYRVGKAVSSGRFQRGFAICGSGMGIHIAAGKFPGVYCALCESVATARRSRVANNCNVLSFGAFYASQELACQMVDAFLDTGFCEGEDEAFTKSHTQWFQELEEFDYYGRA